MPENNQLQKISANCFLDMVDHNIRMGRTEPCFDKILYDSRPTSLDRQPPSNSDFVIAYSTFPGTVQYKCTCKIIIPSHLYGDGITKFHLSRNLSEVPF